VKKAVIALGIAALFMLLSLFSSLGYLGEAKIEKKQDMGWGFWLITTRANMTFNPFLYSLSWLRGQGHLSMFKFSFLSIPQFGGGEFKVPMWRSPQELADEAILRLALSQLYINLLYNFGILLVIEFGKLRKLYFGLIGGIIGFPIGGIAGFPVGATIGAFSGFLSGMLLIVFAIPKLREGESPLIRWWNSLWESDEVRV